MRRLVIVLILVLVGSLLSASKAEAHPHPHLWHWYRSSGAKCVHEAEGSWTANTGNGYYGGYQMSVWFQYAFAPWRVRHSGLANHWTPYRQTIVVRRVVRRYGWSQWSTAPLCGL